MRMNRHIFALFMWIGILFVVPSYAQILTVERHVPVPTDSLQVYKLPYMQATDSGRNCIWDFSNILTDSAEIIDVDYYAPDAASIGLHREHSNIYYHLAQDTLWQTGYETSRAHVRYLIPVPVMKFPFEYGDSLGGAAIGKGQYCHILPISTEGTYSVSADATGRLILPELTLDSALRLHSVFQYQDSKRRTAVKEERYIWYSSYCRYPLLESTRVCAIHGTDTAIAAATYYNPQEPENMPLPREEEQDIDEVLTDSLVTNIAFMPSPVYSDLHVKYTLTRAAGVYISIHYNGGTTTYQTPLRQEDEGGHTTTINMSGLPIGSYVVYIHADDTIVSGNIIKL